MAKKAQITIFLDLTKYNTILSDRTAQLVAVDIRNIAKKKVAVRTHRLQNSIRTDQLAFAVYATIAETPYALAQEYGRPDLPQYKFTPYMRPAGREAGEASRIQKNVNIASSVAISQSRVNKKL